jgi:hypothetical protein
VFVSFILLNNDINIQLTVHRPGLKAIKNVYEIYWSFYQNTNSVAFISCMWQNLSTYDLYLNLVSTFVHKYYYFTLAFLDVAQAFYKVWHEGLVCKLKTILPKQYTEIMDPYLTERFFRIKQGDAYSELKEINAGVP